MLWNPYQYQATSSSFYGILDKKAMESISIGNKNQQDPKRFYGILDKNSMESISIAKEILQDSTGY